MCRRILTSSYVKMGSINNINECIFNYNKPGMYLDLSLLLVIESRAPTPHFNNRLHCVLDLCLCFLRGNQTQCLFMPLWYRELSEAWTVDCSSLCWCTPQLEQSLNTHCLEMSQFLHFYTYITATYSPYIIDTGKYKTCRQNNNGITDQNE